MSFRDMVLRGDYSDNNTYNDSEPSFGSFLKSQSPLMMGWLAIMGLNLLFMLISFQ